MTILLILAAFVLGAAFAYVAVKFFVNKTRDDIKGDLMAAAQEALRNSNETLITLAKERLEHEQTKARSDLDKNRQQVEFSVSRLAEQLKRYEDQMREFEKDRGDKYGRIDKTLKDASESIQKLQQTTDKLHSVLGNVKLRGQWGEKIAEDILRYAGMVQGLHYEKNTAQDTVATRPDFIFKLPDNHRVYMDVKFPLSAYLAYVGAKSDTDRDAQKGQFVSDVKSRIKEITKREYINPAENTLDYILLFIPNEQVYAFANEAAPELIDEAIGKKVILCSPWTLYAVLRIIWQAWENYHTKDNIRNVLALITAFLQEYTKFCEKMGDLGDRIEKTQKSYLELAGTRQRQLDKKIEKIEEYRKGQEPQAIDVLHQEPAKVE
ncbi:MAG TPA: DNA recombination protein RmuC [bacterium]|nr:DNA recombination protein RmuC [bacterium]